MILRLISIKMGIRKKNNSKDLETIWYVLIVEKQHTTNFNSTENKRMKYIYLLR